MVDLGTVWGVPDGFRIEEAQEPSEGLLAAVRSLVAQLSKSADAPSSRDLSELLASPASRLLIARDEDQQALGMRRWFCFASPRASAPGSRMSSCWTVRAGEVWVASLYAARSRSHATLAREPSISRRARTARPRMRFTSEKGSSTARATSTASRSDLNANLGGAVPRSGRDVIGWLLWIDA